MVRLGHCLLLTSLSLLLLVPSPVLAAGVQARFDLSSPTGGPFPSDRFTVPDHSQNTGLRVNLPKPNCADQPSDCVDLDVINTLDGFNMQARLAIPFSGPIDLATVDSRSIFLVRLGDTRGDDHDDHHHHHHDKHHGDGHHDRRGAVVGINQVVWDPDTNTLYAESDDLLEQHTRYALIVTSRVRDLAGDPVEAGAFARLRHDDTFGHTKDAGLKAYRKTVLEALVDVEVRTSRIVAMSVFTTQSATAVLEKIRKQIKATSPAPAQFNLAAGGAVPTVFPRSQITGILWNQQVTTSSALTSVPVDALAAISPDVGTLAFGKYSSPNYLTLESVIPAIGTRTGVPTVQGTNSVYFNLFLPAGPAPATGWPVVIFGHGFTDNKQGAPFAVASTMAAKGIATIAINVVGHGFGSLGTLTVNRVAGNPVTFPAGGRGIDQNGDGSIDAAEGANAAPPQNIIGPRDGLRQTVVDLMQLTRLIETGGLPGLDRSRIYYSGQSFGGIYGTMFLAVEPSVRLGAPNVPGGSIVEITRLSPDFRPLLMEALAMRTPFLLNAISGPPGPPLFGFVDNIPFRDQAPVTNTVPGTADIQAFIDNAEWIQQAGDPVAYARHIRKEPLAGMRPKSVIIQFAKGDQTVPNPTTTAILRAGDLADRATFYRGDLAAAVAGVPTNPHEFLTDLNNPDAFGIALGAQLQIATFFASEVVPGMTPLVIDPDELGLFPVDVFEVPVVLPLPEGLNFIP